MTRGATPAAIRTILHDSGKRPGPRRLVDAPSRLVAPILPRPPGGATLGLAGDAFHAAGGVQRAYLSGLALADRMAAAG